MRLQCVHCGRHFAIAADQLGQQIRCSHCQGSMALPRADEPPGESDRVTMIRPSHWWENSISTLVSLVFHMGIVLTLAFVSLDRDIAAGLGEEIQLAALPSAVLDQNEAQALDVAEPARETARAQQEELEIEPPTANTEVATGALEVMLGAPSVSGEAAGGFDLGAVSGGGGGGGGGNWDGLIKSLRQNGFDIVLTFDSTGSMGGEIEQVKTQIRRLGATLLEMVPKARISLCTYRDRGDRYVVRGIPLAGDLQELEEFLADVSADGGGDTPEAVIEGLRWSIEQNQFRGRARKVILLFGDAPPHQRDQMACLAAASDFYRQYGGSVSTVTCRSATPLREFVEIAEAGGGEAFLTSDERQIVTQLMVLAFGSQYREKVLEAFHLLGK